MTLPKELKQQLLNDIIKRFNKIAKSYGQPVIEEMESK